MCLVCVSARCPHATAHGRHDRILNERKRKRSTAPDWKTPERRTQYWLNRLLNNYNGIHEYADTQIASILMDYDSFQTSHSFVTWFHEKWVKYQRVLAYIAGDQLETEASVVEDDMCDMLPRVDTTNSDEEELGVDLCVTMTEDVSEAEDDDEPQKRVESLKAAPDWEHYARRGSALKDMNPMEWCSLVVVRKRATAEEAEEQKQETDDAEMKVMRFSFEDDGTEWHKTHYQTLRGKYKLLHRVVFHSYHMSFCPCWSAIIPAW